MDFSVALENYFEGRDEKRGYCTVPIGCYDTISGIREDCVTNDITETREPYIIEFNEGSDEPIFRLLAGVTGWESWYVYSLVDGGFDGYWYACAGTPNRYDSLMVNGDEILEILENCGYVSD